MLTVQLTTHPGLEDLTLDELRRATEAAGLATLRTELRPDGLAGHLVAQVDATWDELRPILVTLRSAHRAVRRVARFTLEPADPLGQIREVVRRLTPTLPELDGVDRSFRVTSSRSGTHAFTSEDVQREAGAGVRAAVRHPVSLKAFEVELRCDVRGDTCTVGVQLGALSRGRRGVHTQRTSLRSNVAWAMLRLARPEQPPRRLLDPFSGAGTVLVEAGILWPDVELAGGDALEEATEGSRQNLAEAGLLARAELRTADARALAHVWPAGHFDTVVCNPPFGKRLGRDLDLITFYIAVLRSLAGVTTPDARLVLLAHRRHALNRALDAGVGWRSGHVRIVELGGLYVGVFVLERTPS